MSRPKSLPIMQVNALLLRTFHWERRQYCDIVCKFILSPAILILLTVLNNVLQPEEAKMEPFQQNPTGAYAPRPFDVTACANASTVDIDNPNLQDLIQRCKADPFQPKYSIPVYAPPSIASAVGARSTSNTASNSGLLASFSLNPFAYPPAVDPISSYYNDQTPYDGALLHDVFSGNKLDPFYVNVSQSAHTGLMDSLYNTETVNEKSRQALFSTLYNSWFPGAPVQRYSTAFIFDSFVKSPDGDINVSTTVLDNEVLPLRDGSCTKYCSMISNVVRIYAAIYEQVAPDKSAFVYLRRMPLVKTSDALNFIPLVISIILALVTHAHLPNFLNILVRERSDRIRDYMAAMGLRRPRYWYGTYIALLIMFIISTIVLIVIGIATRVPFFIYNNPVAYIVLFFLWGNSLIAFAIFLEPFFEDPQTAKTFGWLYIVVINIIGGPYIGARISDVNTGRGTWAAIMLLPSFAYMRSVYYAGALNSGGKGVTLGPEEYRGSQLGMCQGAPFCWSFGFLVLDCVILIVLGYFIRRLFHRTARGYPFRLWKRRSSAGTDEVNSSNTFNSKGEDVKEEERRAREIVANIRNQPFDGVVLNELSKSYFSIPPVHALKKLSLVVHKNDVLCILAHNGGGKTTAFRTLVGDLQPTSGDAFIGGYSITSDLDEAQVRMGLAAQKDILWPDLSTQEHLYFYGRVKGLQRRQLREAVQQALSRVQLTAARKRKTKALSGGMRRRLSISIAMMGTPEFVILDEPSTGLDLVARERLWQAIELMRKDKVVLLTTHSLDEAETLSTRVAIMSDGELRCVGTAEDLKLRLGKGHRLLISAPASTSTTFYDELAAVAPGVTIETRVGNNIEFVLPRDISLRRVLSLIDQKKDIFRIRDWSIQQSSLEDVFLKVTKENRSAGGQV